MQVDGPGAQLTAARVGQLRRPQPGQQRPQENYRGAHLPHEMLRDIGAVYRRGINDDGVTLPVGPAAQQAQNVQSGGNVGQVGAVVKHTLPRDKQTGRQDGQDAVLGPVDRQRPPQGPSALNFVIAHGIASKSFGFGVSYAE